MRHISSGDVFPGSSQQVFGVLLNARKQLDKADTLRFWIAEGMEASSQDEEQATSLKKTLEGLLCIKGSDTLKEELEELAQIQWSYARAKQNVVKNRWANVWPWDHSMFPGPYLNASTLPCLPSSMLPVATSQPYVATQSPLPNTFADFYAHLYSSHATLLVNLTPQWEQVGGHKMRKGHRYWPPSNQKTGTSESTDIGGGWKVQVVAHEADNTLLEHMGRRRFDEARDWRIIKRLLKVTPPSDWAETQPDDYAACLCRCSTSRHRNGLLPKLSPVRSDCQDGRSRLIEMIHVEHWRDGGDATGDNFVRLVELVADHQRRQRQQGEQSDSVAAGAKTCAPPIWVHCSAGIGRTGTLIAGLIAREIVLSPPGGDCSEDETQLRRRLTEEISSVALTVQIWCHMRTRRSGLITTAEQAMMIWTEIERLKRQRESGQE